MRLSEYDLKKMEYIGSIRRLNDWEWFEFHHDPEKDIYYVSNWCPCGVDLSGDKVTGGGVIPREDINHEPTEEYIRLLENYCRE